MEDFVCPRSDTRAPWAIFSLAFEAINYEWHWMSPSGIALRCPHRIIRSIDPSLTLPKQFASGLPRRPIIGLSAWLSGL